MSDRSSPRWLAPLALLAGLLAVVLVVSSSGGDGDRAGAPAPTATSTTGDGERSGGSGEESAGDGEQEQDGEQGSTSTTSTTSTTKAGGTYTVQSGDSFATIAGKTGASVEELRELNPDLDPTELQVGDEVRVPR